MVERNKVYEVIDSEIHYSNEKYGKTLSSDREGDGSRSLDEFALYIGGLSNKLTIHCSEYASKEEKLIQIRKIAALCVKCMEQHGAIPR